MPFTSDRFRSGYCSRRALGCFAVLVPVLFAAACENTEPLTASRSSESKGGVAQPSFAQFSDVPVPGGARMDLERSLVLGERDAWIGRLVMSIDSSPSRTYDFYFSEMPRFGWTPVTTVRAGTSVLTYTRGARVATIQISGRTLGGAEISMTVSPKGAPVGASGGGTSGFGSGGGVSSTPLR